MLFDEQSQLQEARAAEGVEVQQQVSRFERGRLQGDARPADARRGGPCYTL